MIYVGEKWENAPEKIGGQIFFGEKKSKKKLTSRYVRGRKSNNDNE